MLIVLSPAKNLDYESPLTTERYSQPDMLDSAEELIEALRELAPQDISSLMSISDKLGVLNYDRYQQWSRPFSTDNARPAVLAFNGDVYTGLEADTMSDDDLQFAQEHLRILSGLYGLLRPLDLMQPYRLEMGTRFANSKGKNLYEFWGNRITEAINDHMDSIGSVDSIESVDSTESVDSIESAVLINLASNEYFKSVKPKQLNAEVITPVFKDAKNGQYKVISFFAKKARGKMASYIIRNRITDAEAIKAFDLDGYYFDEASSEPNKPVFLREEAEA